MSNGSYIEKVFGSLSERGRHLLKEKYGIDLENPSSIESSNEKHVELRRRIREIERKALRKLYPGEEYIEPHGAECSFCFKLESEVDRMIKDPSGTNICNECVMLCSEILQKERNN